MTLQELFPAMSGSELAEALWCVVSLRLKPDEQWMDAYMATCEDRVGGLPPQVSCRARGVCERVCMCVHVYVKVDEQWMDAYMATCEDRVGGLPPQVSCRARGVCVCLCVFVCVHMCAYM